MSKETTVDDLMNEFEIDVPGMAPVDVPNGTPATPTNELEAAIQARELEEAAKAKTLEAAKTPPIPEEEEEEVDDEIAAATAATAEPTKAPSGQADSFYKNLAQKYIANGTWGSDLAIEALDGTQIPIEDLEDLNEETFFEIQKSIQEAKAEELKANYLPIDKLDERRKNLLTIITEGGDLKDIFTDEKQAEAYINPFGTMDLEDPATQERVYLNALIKHNNLDQAAAIEVVKAAKKDLSLDTRVKTFVENYTKNFDAYVDKKKEEIIQAKATERQELLKFKKDLSEQYKNYELKPSLVRRLTDSAVQETDEGYQIDTIYEQKMKDPVEAAELILFLNDKEAYLENKLKATKRAEQVKTRRLVKIIPSSSKGKTEPTIAKAEANSEFEIQVPMT